MARRTRRGPQALSPELANMLAQAAQRLQARQLAEAGALLSRARQLAPQHPEVVHLAGHLELAQGKLESAIPLFQQALRLAPKSPVFTYNLGLAYAKLQDYQQAQALLQKTVRLGLRNRDTLTSLAVCEQNLGNPKVAEGLFVEVTRLAPNDMLAWLNLAKIRHALGGLDAARAAIEQARHLASGRADIPWGELAQVHCLLEEWPEALAACDGGLAHNSANAELWFLRGRALFEMRAFAQAEEAYRQAQLYGYDPKRVQLAQARILISTGSVDNGLRLLSRVAEQAGDDVPLLLQVAVMYSMSGDFEQEAACLQRVLAIEPNNLQAQIALLSVPGRWLDERSVASMANELNNGALDAKTASAIGFALGNHYASSRDYDQAFACYQKGNRLKGARWDGQAYQQWVDEVLSVMTHDFFAQRLAWGDTSRQPLLIVGLPRSGTTLVEQILSAHSLVCGAGELGSVAALAARADALPVETAAHCLDALDEQGVRELAQGYLEQLAGQPCGNVKYVSNKLPHNFEQLGLFGMLFPKAPVIHVRRDPRDNLLSIYFNDFAGQHGYAYDLENLALLYWQQERLMAHWKRVLSNPVLTLDYEGLVTDLEGTIARTAGFLDLSPEAAMWHFHEQQREVRTLSKWQVRQKLYTTSMARWQPYGKHLKPLFDALREFAPEGRSDEYGLFGMEEGL